LSEGLLNVAEELHGWFHHSSCDQHFLDEPVEEHELYESIHNVLTAKRMRLLMLMLTKQTQSPTHILMIILALGSVESGSRAQYSRPPMNELRK